MPTSSTTRLITVAKTGRRMEMSGESCNGPRASAARGAGALCRRLARRGLAAGGAGARRHHLHRHAVAHLDRPAVTTTSPGSRPSTISTSPAAPLAEPHRRHRTALRPAASTTLNTKCWSPTGTSDCSGTNTRPRGARRASGSRARTGRGAAHRRGWRRARGSPPSGRRDRPPDRSRSPRRRRRGRDRRRPRARRAGRRAPTAQEHLGHAEIDLERIDLLEVDDLGAGLDELADADLAQAEHAVERRLERVLVEPRARARLTIASSVRSARARLVDVALRCRRRRCVSSSARSLLARDERSRASACASSARSHRRRRAGPGAGPWRPSGPRRS